MENDNLPLSGMELKNRWLAWFKRNAQETQGFTKKQREEWIRKDPEYAYLRTCEQAYNKAEHITPERAINELIYKNIKNATPEQLEEWIKEAQEILNEK